MKDLRLGAKIIAITFRQSTAQFGWVLADALSLFMRCGVLLILYSYAFSVKGGTIAGQSYNVVAWSMFMYFMFMVFRIRQISQRINEDIQTGNMEMFCNKPFSYLFYRMCSQVGAGASLVVVLVPVSVAVMVCLVKVPPMVATPLFWITLVPVVLGCLLLSLFIYSIIGLVAFWIEDMTPIYWMTDKAVMILGGSYLPIAFFPPLMKALAVYSPFGASQFLTHMTMESWKNDAWRLIGIQWTWVVVLFVTMLWMYKNARRKLSVNGG